MVYFSKSWCFLWSKRAYFPCSYPFISASFVGKEIIPHLITYVSASFWSQLILCKSIWGLSFYLFVFLCQYHSLQYYSFIVVSKLGNIKPAILFHKMFWVILRPLHGHTVFKISSSMSTKTCIREFDYNWVESIDKFWRTDILAIFSLPIHKYIMYPFVYILNVLISASYSSMYISVAYFLKPLNILLFWMLL